jgi:hypothetical protein
MYVRGEASRSLKELQKNAHRILDVISREDILAILREWKTRLQKVITIDGNYVGRVI